MKKIYFFLIILIVVIALIILFYQKPIEKVNSTMEYGGTKYVNCHINPNFPIQTSSNKIILSGIAEEVTGSKTCPINGVSLSGKLLFDIKTDNVSRSYGDNLYETIGKNIKIEGYLGGEKTVCGEKYEIFYITNIIGWKNICCDATLEDTGNISTPNVCFWFEK